MFSFYPKIILSVTGCLFVGVFTASSLLAASDTGTGMVGMFGYGVAVFLVISLLAWVLVRLSRREQISLGFGSTWFRALVLIGLSLFLVTVAVIGNINLERSRRTHLQDIGRKLAGTLSVYRHQLDLWLVERKSYMEQIGLNPELLGLTRRLLRVSPDKDKLLASNELREIRTFFNTSGNVFPNIGFFIINPDLISIGSRRDTNIGTLNLIARQHPEILNRAFQGEVGFVPPITSDVHLGDSGKSDRRKKPPTMFFIGPIKDFDGHILAVMTLRVDPWRDVENVVSSLSDLQSGEIYAFDENGRMLTPSRFDNQLKKIGLLVEGQGSALNIEIRDPGVNMVAGEVPKLDRSRQPLTRMAENAGAMRRNATGAEAMAEKSEISTDVAGYRDYRGVPVFGAWTWSHNLNIGLAAEIDVEEAMSHYYQTRFMVVGTLGFTLLISVAAVLVVMVLGERTSRTLQGARDDLELRVKERTTELEQQRGQLQEAEERSRLLLNSAGEGIFGVNTDGIINFINPSALEMLGYTEEELIGREVHQAIHHSHQDGSSYKLERCPMYHSYMKGTSDQITDEVLWRKDGSFFHVEYSSTPIRKDGSILGAVVTFLDITDRKRMEAALLEEKSNLQTILDTSPVGVGISIDGIMRFANPRILDLLNVRIGDPTPDIYVSPEDRKKIVDELEKRKLIKDYELQMYGRGGTVRDMLVTYISMSWEGRGALLGWVMDITDLKTTERELQVNLDELSRFQDFAIGREQKMIELKKEINDLLGKLNQDPKYKIVGD